MSPLLKADERACDKNIFEVVTGRARHILRTKLRTLDSVHAFIHIPRRRQKDLNIHSLENPTAIA